jgi:hypothetical protein
MPIVPGNPLFPNQYGFNGTQPYTTQLNFGQMIGEVQLWNPDIDPLLIARMINNNYRKVIERRYWYGLMLRGQINTPQMTTVGSVSVVNGSTAVTGIGTSWTVSLQGQQFRVGFTNPWQTIVQVIDATHLILDVPYGGSTLTTTGYQIAAVYWTLGANVRYILDAVNQQQGWRMSVNVPVQSVNEADAWRTSVGWSYFFVNREPTPDGQLQIEIYPSPFFLQVFPFWAATQPPNLNADADSPVAFIRADVLVKLTIADALLWGGKNNKYYDPTVASWKAREAETDLNMMERSDDGMWQQDSVWAYGLEWGYNTGQGSLFAQNHPISEWH